MEKEGMLSVLTERNVAIFDPCSIDTFKKVFGELF